MHPLRGNFDRRSESITPSFRQLVSYSALAFRPSPFLFCAYLHSPHLLTSKILPAEVLIFNPLLLTRTPQSVDL